MIHQRVDYPWTIAALASEVGVSRSKLVERFTRYLSEPPMTYLTRWRLQLAAHRLARTAKGVAEIAAGVGYQSEAAFSRAFKAQFGLPPAQYRREQKNPADGVVERHPRVPALAQADEPIARTNRKLARNRGVASHLEA